MNSELETFTIPNPLILAAINFYSQISCVEDPSPVGQHECDWRKSVLATSLGARFGLNIDAVKTDAEKLDPEKDIPEKKQSEVF